MNRRTSCKADGRVVKSRPGLTRPFVVTPEDEREFQLAMEDYKRSSGRQFPTWSEILEVLQSIGYAKRIWRPIEPAQAVAAEGAPARCFHPMGQDEVTGLQGWYSRVETPSGY